MPEDCKLLPILLNGKRYTLDPTSAFAINTEGKAVCLEHTEEERR